MNRTTQLQVRWFSAALLAGSLVACPAANEPTPPVNTDIVPDAFSFSSVQSATAVQEASIVVAGINAASPVSIGADGEYRINDGAFTNTSGSVNNGDRVTVRPKTPVVPGHSLLINVSIGGVPGTFSISIPSGSPQSGAPGFSGDFAAVNYAVPGSVTTSNAVMVTGLEAGAEATASVAGGLMLVGSNLTAVPSASVQNGDSIKLVINAANAFGQSSPDAVLSLAGASTAKTFKVKTGVLGASMNLPLETSIPATGLAVADTTPSCITENDTEPNSAERGYKTGPGQDPLLNGLTPDFTLYPYRKRNPGDLLLDGVTASTGYYWENALGEVFPTDSSAPMPSYTTLFNPGYVWNDANPWANTKLQNTWQICPPAGQFQKGVTSLKFGLAQANVERAGKVVLETIIEHGYRGDLRIALIAPDGKTAMVYDLPDKGVASPQDVAVRSSAGIAIRFDDDAMASPTGGNKSVDVDVRCGFFNATTSSTDAGNCWDNAQGGWKFANTAPGMVRSKGTSLTGLRGVPIGGAWTLRIEDVSPGNYEQTDAAWPEGKGPKQEKGALVWRAVLSVQPIKPAP